MRSSRLTRIALGLLGVLAVAALAAACGVPLSNAPQIERSVPDGLVVRPSSGVLPVECDLGQPSKHCGADEFDIDLVINNRLFPVNRVGKATPQDVLTALDDGPTPVEEARGVETQIPAGAQATVVRRRGHVLTVNLDANFGGDLSITAIAQIVWTLTTQVRGVTGVLFYVIGLPTSAPTENESYSSAPITQGDYARYSPARG